MRAGRTGKGCPPGFDALVDPSSEGGRGIFTTISGALDSLAGGKGRIFISSGLYTETLVVSGTDIVLVGEDPFTTVIVGYEARTNGIARNALVHYTGGGGVLCGSFSGENITFYNKGAEWNEAISHPEKRGAALFAENIRGGHFSNCLFLGQQDTLYLKNGTLQFDNCYIEGHVDYICGGASALFSGCQLHSLLSPQGYIAAIAPLNECGERDASGIPPGFTFNRCLLTCDSAQTVPLHLGRGPWINGSGLDEERKIRTPSICTFTGCTIGTKDSPFLLDCQMPWQDMDRPCKDERYREYGNTLNGSRMHGLCPE
jgi:pectinesterase